MTIEQIIERIIKQEIFVNASTMVTDLCNGELSQFDEGLQEKLLDCLGAPDYSELPGGYDVHKETHNLETGAFTDWVVTGGDDDIMLSGFDTEEEANQAAWEDSGEEPEMQEALQFWLVSDWLADKLEEVGAPVARDVLGFNVWGRTECGQSLTMDSTLHAVAKLIK